MVRSEGSKKSDRKFDKKLEFHSNVRETVATLSAKKAIEKNKSARKRLNELKAYDLSNLAELLPELNTELRPPAPASDPRKNCKAKQKLVLQESERLMTVFSDPAFQSNPLAVIHQHIQSTQPPVETEPRKKSNHDVKRKRKKKSRTPPAHQSKEM